MNEMPVDEDYVLDDDESEDEFKEPSYCMHDYDEAIEFGLSHRLSVNVITGLINKAVKCVGITEKNMICSPGKVYKTAKRLGIKIRKKHSELNKNLVWEIYGQIMSIIKSGKNL